MIARFILGVTCFTLVNTSCAGSDRPFEKSSITVTSKGPDLIAIATNLLGSGNYDPEGGATKCNIFASDFGQSAFSYAGFLQPDMKTPKLANDIVSYLRTKPAGWTCLYDPEGKYDCAAGLSRAQDLANLGTFVIAGLSLAPDTGHVAVVMPGSLEGSDKWEKAHLPRMLPMIAQAGDDVFPKPGQLCKHLGWGFSPAKVMRGIFVIYAMTN